MSLFERAATEMQNRLENYLAEAEKIVVTKDVIDWQEISSGTSDHVKTVDPLNGEITISVTYTIRAKPHYASN